MSKPLKPRLIIKEGKDNVIQMTFNSENKKVDMNKFMELLYGGFLQGLMLVGQISDELEVQEDLYNYAQGIINSGLFQAFPKVIEKIKKEEELELEVVKAVDDGDPISEETLENIEIAKSKIKERFSKQNAETLKEQQERILVQLEKEIEDLEFAKTYILNISGAEEIEIEDSVFVLDYKNVEDGKHDFLDTTYELIQMNIEGKKLKLKELKGE